MGSCSQDPTHLYPGTGFLYCRVLRTSLGQEYPHKDAGCPLNNALRTITGCLRATPVNQLPILAGIVPANLSREAATLTLSRTAVKSVSRLLHDVVTIPPILNRLKSRRPFTQTTQRPLQSVPPDVSKNFWLRNS